MNSSSTNQSSSIYEKEISILGNSENQKILKIFEEIKRLNNRNSFKRMKKMILVR